MIRLLFVLVVAGALLGVACVPGATPAAKPSGGTAPAAQAPAQVVTTDASAPPAAPIPVKASYSAFSMSQSPIAIAREAGYFTEELRTPASSGSNKDFVQHTAIPPDHNVLYKRAEKGQLPEG